MSEAPLYAPPPRLCRSRTWREGHLHFADGSRRLTSFVQAMDCLPPHCLGDSRIRTHSALEIYGRATPSKDTRRTRFLQQAYVQGPMWALG